MTKTNRTKTRSHRGRVVGVVAVNAIGLGARAACRPSVRPSVCRSCVVGEVRSVVKRKAAGIVLQMVLLSSVVILVVPAFALRLPSW